MVPERSCVEVLAVVFGDTILDVAQVDEHTPSYRIGEGESVRIPVSGDGLPDPAGFALVWAGAGGFWLGFCPSMDGIVLDHRGRRSLGQLVAEGRAVAADGAHHVLLEAGETIWVEQHGVRFRVRIVSRELVRASTWTVDRPYLASLMASAAVFLAFGLLMRAQPAPLVEHDEHRAVLARLLQREPALLEPVPGPASEALRSIEPNVVEDRAAASTPLLEPPDPRPRGTKREQPLWVAASVAQAVGRLGRNHDPIEAARHAGILGVLGDRRFAGERVFDPEFDDAQLWATTAEVAPTWMSDFGLSGPGRRLDGEMGLIGTGSYGLMPGEGVVGWGSYGAHHRVASWRDRSEEDRELEALCSADCRRPTQLRPTIVHIGKVDVQGATDRDVARRIVRAHITELRRCFEQTITERRAEFAGEIEFSLVRGKVGAIVTDPAFPDDLAECMKRSIRRWQFPSGSASGSGQATDMITVSLRLSR